MTVSFVTCALCQAHVNSNEPLVPCTWESSREVAQLYLLKSAQLFRQYRAQEMCTYISASHFL
jgi:hypothetical protein